MEEKNMNEQQDSLIEPSLADQPEQLADTAKKQRLVRLRAFFARFRGGRLHRVGIWLAQHPALQALVFSFFIAFVIYVLGSDPIGRGKAPSLLGGLRNMVFNFHFFLINMLIIAVTMIPGFFFRRRYFVYAVVTVMWLGLGVTNCVLMNMRVTPLEAVDFSIFTTGFEIMDKYMSLPSILLAAAAIVAALAVLVVMWFKLPRTKKVPYVRAMVGSVVMALTLTVVLVGGRSTGIIPKQVGNLRDPYQKYGFVFCFTTSVFDKGIGEPEEYTSADIAELQDSYKDLVTAENENMPNIIFLQLESFFNVMDLQTYTFSEDPTPFFNSLKSEYPSGYLTVPSIGAGTANTEFEVITGMRLYFFGMGEYPYKTVLQKKTCESTPYLLKKFDYTTTAIHNHTGSFYDRDLVYANLGFDYFISSEFMEDYENKNPIGWVRDEVLIDEIMNALTESESKDYIYTVSVQGHGGYPTEDVGGGFGIEPTGGFEEDEELAMQYTYYINQLRDMDQFLRGLTESLAAYGEDVVLVMYGDHLPSLDLKQSDFKENTATLFQTEYIIWSNREGVVKNAVTDTGEPVRQNVSAYQLAAYVTDLLDIHEGNVLRYHQVASAGYSQIADDNRYPDDMSEEVIKLIKQYDQGLHMLQYDMLYGEQYLYGTAGSPYKQVDMQMGLYDITVTGAENIEKGGFGYLVYGTHFTPFTYVYINGEKAEDIIYYDASTIIVFDDFLEDGDEITLQQKNYDIESEPYIFTTDD